MENLSYFIILALIAEVLGTVGGFGSSIFFVPIAGLFFDFHSVLGITALFHLSSNVTKIAAFKKGFNIQIVLQIGMPAVLFVIGGAFLTKYFNNYWLEILLAIFLMLISIFLLFFPSFSLNPDRRNSIIGGSLSGLAAGLLGTGGAIRGLTLAAFNLEINTFIATSAIIDLGIDLSRSVVYFTNGYMHKHDMYLIPILLCVSIVGTLIGKYLLRFFTQNQFKILVLCLILLTGLYTLLRNLS